VVKDAAVSTTTSTKSWTAGRGRRDGTFD